MYRVNLTRQIADVNSTPSKVITDLPDNKPLDLIHTQLRAAPSAYISYLKKMGVASSFSISLIYNDELWGLTVCHNYSPRFIDYLGRESVRLTGQILSAVLELKHSE